VVDAVFDALVPVRPPGDGEDRREGDQSLRRRGAKGLRDPVGGTTFPELLVIQTREITERTWAEGDVMSCRAVAAL